ncbi:MAG: radical SAM protein [Bacteroidetes bacterium]|nr:radical SAM protein [Bacteroidota bacterium]
MPTDIQVKSILNKTKRRDPWFLDDYTINPYSGCSFNCLFCYIRGSKYGTHMEEKLSVKANAVELLEKQLHNRAKKGQYGIIVMSSATDPYLHFEKDLQLTRQLLEVILHYRFPLHVITRSTLVLRDLDLIQQISEQAILPADLESKLKQKAFITFSFSTVDDKIASIFEPGAPPPSERLETLRTVASKDFLTGVSMMPLLPYISDTGEHLELMFQSFKNAGAQYIFPSTITLFGNNASDSKTLVFRAVEKHYPHLLEKYHRLFDNSTQLPAYYNNAFHTKAMELCHKFAIRNSII